MKFLELYVSAVVMTMIFYWNGKILLNDPNYKIKAKSIAIMFLFSLSLTVLNSVDSEIMRGIFKTTISYIMICIYYKFLFTKDSSRIIISSFITCLSTFLSEVIIAIPMSLIFEVLNISSMMWLKNTIIINFLICALSYIIIYFNSNRLKNLVNTAELYNKKIIWIIFLILIIVALLAFKIPLSNWGFNIEFISTMILLFGCSLIGIIIMKQKSDIEKTKAMYHQLANYSDTTNGLLEDYRIISHEHKNQLSIIRGMVGDDNKELSEYIDNLIDKRKMIKYQWIGQLNYLPLSGLKGLISYKLIEMESNKLEININISKEISRSKFKLLSSKQKDELYSIIGVYLDNAIQASTVSKNKEISLEIYKEKSEIIITLANTYKDEIDLKRINEYGYTTKGKNHGIGLHIVKKITQDNNMFSCNTRLFDKYFIQELRIDLSTIKK